MKKLIKIIFISITILLCACGKNKENYKYQPSDVSAKNQQAQELYDSGQFKESFVVFSEAMQEEPKDITARIGVIRCQIAFEDYSMALMNLNSAIEIMPEEETLYSLFLEIGELKDDISIAQRAVDLAKRYSVESFLKKVPEKPVFTYESGNYDRRIEASIQSAESDADGTEIFFSVNKVDGYRYFDMKYVQPWMLTSGETRLTAYCVKDGIPSETAEATYICEYEPSPVQFKDAVMEKLVRDMLAKAEGEITDIDCEQITDLSVYNLQIDGMSYEEAERIKVQTLDDLEYFPNLTHLDLGYRSEVNDYSSVKLCPQIYEFCVENSELADIGFISDLPNLYYLYLPNNRITDLTPVQQCKELRYLYINGNPVADIPDLTELEELYGLRVSKEQLKDISILKELENLTNLTIYCQGNDNISEIGELTQLESLEISYEYWKDDYDKRSYIKDISYLENLTNLTYLNISGLEDLSQIEILKKLVNLDTLYLYNRNSNDSNADEEAIKELQQALPKCSIRY